MEKVILISIDGMRPDGFLQCGHPFAAKMMKLGTYSLCASSMQPSVTLPCHMSMFHSVPPERHGITSNTYLPFARPVSGLCEQINMAGGACAMFYGWEPIRDVSRPGSMKYTGYIHSYAKDNTDGILTNAALQCMRDNKPDFVFLYMVETDEKGGHDNGWMSEAYLSVINSAIGNVEKVYREFGEEYTIIVTADHGGHDRAHGTLLPEDMTIPMFFIGKRFTPAKEIPGISLLDIAPTVADIMSVNCAPEWEGKSIAE